MTTKYTQYPYCKPANDSAYSTNTYNMRRIPGFRTKVVSHEPIHSKARVNWLIFGSWSVILIMWLAFWAGVIALFM